MEKRTKRKFNADFKTKVVIEAIKERETIESISRKYELHPNQVTTWKKEFLNNAAAAFASKTELFEDKKQQEADREKLYAQIGQQKMEIEWLKKKLQ